MAVVTGSARLLPCLSVYPIVETVDTLTSGGGYPRSHTALQHSLLLLLFYSILIYSHCDPGLALGRGWLPINISWALNTNTTRSDTFKTGAEAQRAHRTCPLAGISDVALGMASTTLNGRNWATYWHRCSGTADVCVHQRREGGGGLGRGSGTGTFLTTSGTVL